MPCLRVSSIIYKNLCKIYVCIGHGRRWGQSMENAVGLTKEAWLAFCQCRVWEEEWFAWVFSFMTVSRRQKIRVSSWPSGQQQGHSRPWLPILLLFSFVKWGFLAPTDREVVEVKQRVWSGRLPPVWPPLAAGCLSFPTGISLWSWAKERSTVWRSKHSLFYLYLPLCLMKQPLS